jgi:Conserved region of Rad21 / Rec8 like protein
LTFEIEVDGRFVGQFLGDADVESATFQEMFPTETSARQVLANALFNTCCAFRCVALLTEVLATRGVIAVEQMEPFGDISVKMAS